jgi:hypothetical protein
MTSLIKKTLLGSLIALGTLTATIFAFGSADPLRLNVPPKTPVIRFEALQNAPASISSENVTREVARHIAQELTEKNPNGPGDGTSAGIETVNPGELTERILDEAFEEINVESLRPVINISDLNVIQSGDDKLATQYFNNLNEITIRNFPAGTSVNWENPELTNFAALITAYGASMSESLRLAVPENLAELHRQFVTLLGAEKNTLTIIKNYQTDPAQAAVAIIAGDSFTTELADVLTQMNAYIAEHNLIISS